MVDLRPEWAFGAWPGYARRLRSGSITRRTDQRESRTNEASAASMTWPVLIQGGMGIGVSGWPLARAVSRRGQLGVVSGTGIDSLFVRRQIGKSTRLKSSHV